MLMGKTRILGSRMHLLPTIAQVVVGVLRMCRTRFVSINQHLTPSRHRSMPLWEPANREQETNLICHSLMSIRGLFVNDMNLITRLIDNHSIL